MKKKLLIIACALFMCANVFAQTQWTVNNTASWQTAVNGITNGGNNRTHTVTVSGTVSVPGTDQYLFGDAAGITVTLQGSGALALSSNGCLLTIGSGKTVVVRDITLQGRDGNDFSIVNIGGGGTFRMEGNASIRGNGKSGVDVYGGTFIMENGTVSGNGTIGVFVGGGTFIMENGAISGNTVPAANINVEGGNISFNGAGVCVRGGTFTMRGGAISGNFIEASGGGGGGVAVYGGGIFTMEGGAISGNSVRYGYDGLPANGGGVYVGSDGTFIMQGGAISGNTVGITEGTWGLAGHGGGVYVSSSGTFTMQGGTISGNTASDSSYQPGFGGGVYINNTYRNGGTFIKTGGTIHGGNETNASLRNTAPGSTSGHAVYYDGGQWNNSAKSFYRDTTLPANASGNISTTSALPTASGQTLNNWTRR